MLVQSTLNLPGCYNAVTPCQHLVNNKPLKVQINILTMHNRSTLFIFVAVIAVIGVGLYMRSYYVRTDGKYLLTFDPYYHYRMAETIVEQGSRPEWDTIAAYPTGAPVNHPPLFHYYLAYTYKIVNIFSDITLYRWCIYANIIPIVLTLVFAFYAGKTLTNGLGGIFTALFVAVNGAIVSRTVISYTDTDIWIVLFSFAATYFLFKTIKTEENAKYIWSCLLGFTLFLFAFTWTAYEHFLLLVGAAFVIYILMDAIRKQFDKSLFSAFAVSFLSFVLPWSIYKQYYISGIALAVLGVVWIVGERFSEKITKYNAMPVISAAILGVVAKVLYDEKIIVKAMRTSEVILGSGPSSKAFYAPDISISILQRFDITVSTLSQLFSVLLLVAPFGIALLLWKRDKFSLQTLVYLGLYLVGTGVLLFWGGRYSMLFAVPLILVSGVFFGLLPEALKGKVTSKGVWAVVCICALSVVPCYISGSSVSEASATMDDNVWEALTWISENTPEDAVVIAGWDMGYWIESVAKRKSVMNGAHYDIWWRVVKYGKLLETQDESIAVKEVYGFDDASEVEAIRNFPETEHGQNALEKEMSGFVKDNAYVLVSEWTMLTFYWHSYYGTWDYTTGEGEGRIYNPLWIQGARKLVSGTDYTYGDQSIAFSVIREGINYHSYIIDQSGYVPTIGTLFFKEGQLHFLKRETGEFAIVYVPPKSIAYFMTEREWPDAPSEVFLIREEDLACMLTWLYFFNGEGLEYFELVKDCGTAKVYKVHKVSQEFNQGVITEEDTYEPV